MAKLLSFASTKIKGSTRKSGSLIVASKNGDSTHKKKQMT
jgi:hypothetical protein